MSTYDAPNQQVVREDGSGPGMTAGEQPEPETANPEPAEDLDALTKAELLELAKARGVTPANNDMTKAELIAGIEAES